MIEGIKTEYNNYRDKYKAYPKRLFMSRYSFKLLKDELIEMFPASKSNPSIDVFWSMKITIVKSAKIKPHKFLVAEI